MRPSFFLLPTVVVVAPAVACQPGRTTPAMADAGNGDAPPGRPAGVPAQACPAPANAPRRLGRVGGTAPAPLRVGVAYGEAKCEIAAPTQGADGGGGTGAEGTPGKLRIQRAAWQAGMSGREFEGRAMLTVGTRQLRGGGGF